MPDGQDYKVEPEPELAGDACAAAAWSRAWPRPSRATVSSSSGWAISASIPTPTPGKPVFNRTVSLRDTWAKIEKGILMNEAVIRLHIEPLEEGGYVATSPDVPGLVAEGRSIVEAVEIAQGLARRIAESCLEHGRSAAAGPGGTDTQRALDVVVPVGIRSYGPIVRLQVPRGARRLRRWVGPTIGPDPAAMKSGGISTPAAG